MASHRAIRRRFAQFKARPGFRRISVREVSVSLIVSGLLVGKTFGWHDAMENVVEVIGFAIGFGVLLPWLEYASYWWAYPNARERDRERRLRELGQSYKKLAKEIGKQVPTSPTTVPEPQEPPQLSYEIFDGARAGVEVVNRGGECRLAGKVRVKEVYFTPREYKKQPVLRTKERRDALWLQSPRTTNKGPVIRRDESSLLVLASFEETSGAEYYFRLHGWDEVVQWWRFDPSKTYERILDGVLIEVEITTTPVTPPHRANYHISINHDDKVLTCFRL